LTASPLSLTVREMHQIQCIFQVVPTITTGERYVIEDQNPDGTAGEINETGRIIISGNTLPITTDVLQVDYIWIKSFDKVFDFDNLKDYNKNRTAQDSVDWSFGNLVVNEPSVVQDIDGDLVVDVSHPIYSKTSRSLGNTDANCASSQPLF
jgi:hypothetical protein